jgi:hydroxyethylthiazole kinase
MGEQQIAGRAAEALGRLRETRPLVHHITNFVVMNDTANVTLLIGASPVMAHAIEEVEEMVSLAGALVLNPGTLQSDWIEAMILAGRCARERGIPVVLDPVGAGATTFRTRTNQRLLEEVRPTIVRGNAGEIGALSGVGGEVRGVDSVVGLSEPEQAVRHVARQWGGVVAITGVRDLVSDGERLLAVDNGHEWLTTLTGTGCMATAIVGAFAAAEPDPLLAAAAGLAGFGLAAERAARETTGPGSFKTAIFDELYGLSPDRLADGARLFELA